MERKRRQKKPSINSALYVILSCHQILRFSEVRNETVEVQKLYPKVSRAILCSVDRILLYLDRLCRFDQDYTVESVDDPSIYLANEAAVEPFCYGGLRATLRDILSVREVFFHILSIVQT